MKWWGLLVMLQLPTSCLWIGTGFTDPRQVQSPKKWSVMSGMLRPNLAWKASEQLLSQ